MNREAQDEDHAQFKKQDTDVWERYHEWESYHEW